MADTAVLDQAVAVGVGREQEPNRPPDGGPENPEQVSVASGPDVVLEPEQEQGRGVGGVVVKAQ